MGVSVVIATHNGSRFVGEQLESILRQTRPVDEFVVVDDASTDGTPDLAAELLKGQRLQLVRRPAALGISGNVGDGLRRATGEVLFLSDQDDVWHPRKVERVLAALERKPGVHGVFTDGREVGGDGTPTGRRLWQATAMTGPRRERFAHDPVGQLLTGNSVTGATMALRRDVLDLVLPFPETGWHDAWIALLLAVTFGPDGLLPLDEELIDYRVHGTNLSGGLAPTGRWTGLGWHVAKGVPAEQRDLAMLRELVVRLRSQGTETIRLDRKIAFQDARAGLAADPLRRLPFVLRSMRNGSYDVYAAGRASAIADLVFHDASVGHAVPRGISRT